MHAVTTPEDVAYVFQIADFPFSDPNDTPSNALSAVVISTLPASGTLRAIRIAGGGGPGHSGRKHHGRQPELHHAPERQRSALRELHLPRA